MTPVPLTSIPSRICITSEKESASYPASLLTQTCNSSAVNVPDFFKSKSSKILRNARRSRAQRSLTDEFNVSDGSWLKGSKKYVKNLNFGQKSKCWSKIDNLVKNRNFGQKSKYWSKIEILVKNRHFCKKIGILVKQWNFGQKSIVWSKIQILVKNPNFGRKSKFL